MLSAQAEAPRPPCSAAKATPPSPDCATEPKPKAKPKKPALACDEPTLARLEELGEAQCVHAEVAGALGVTVKTLNRFLERKGDAREAFEKGRARGLERLRRAQLKLAETNATMAIFLGRTYLGQAEQKETEPVGAALDIAEAGQRLRDKLAALAAARAAGEDS